jgi:neurotransmitter:Na+ symporter, NSS family
MGSSGMRQRWRSSFTFVLAAIGSAVGFGNIWRFPYLAYKHGGGAFLFPYLIALCVLGLPLLIMELSIGQKLQKGAVCAFKAIHPRLRGIGFLAVCCSFFVVIYYAVVMSWAALYFVRSFSSELPWQASPENYFFNSVLNISDSISILGEVNLQLLAALFAVWLIIYFCIQKGVKSIGKVVLITVPLPIILLLIIFFRSIFLEGAWEGIYYYICPNFDALFSAEIWEAAISQILFTCSIGMGIMIAYASFAKPTSDMLKSGMIILFTDAIISVFAGFVVFAVMGYMAHQTGVTVPEVATSGPGLAFVIFPKALSLMPWSGVFSVLFFLALLSVGVDTVFSFVESFHVVICDAICEVKKEQIALWLCTLCFVMGLVFTTNAGFYFLDLVDHFVINISLVFVTMLECIAIGWYFGAENLRNHINTTSRYRASSKWVIITKYIVPCITLALLCFNVIHEIKVPYNNYPSWALATGWGIVLAPILIAAFMAIHLPKEENKLTP